MAQNIIYSPWEGTKGPWLCLLTNCYCFVLFDCFSLLLYFLISLIKLILWLKLFHRKKAGGVHGEKDHSVLLCFISNSDNGDSRMDMVCDLSNVCKARMDNNVSKVKMWSNTDVYSTLIVDLCLQDSNHMPTTPLQGETCRARSPLPTRCMGPIFPLFHG